MDVATALKGRRSIRDFKPDPIPDALLAEVLEEARWAPSWSNTQPYRLGLVSGEKRHALSATLASSFDAGRKLQRGSAISKLKALVTREGLPSPDVAVPMDYPDDLQEARRATGFGLYGMLGIERADFAARDRQMRRNYEFFGAPAVAFLFGHQRLGLYAALDTGVFLQSLMLAAQARGLGTCAQGALAIWAAPVRALFDVPPDYRLLVGVSIGFPTDAAVNAFSPGRPSADALLLKSR
jgi:nitroreductase